jgi:hypothetical protein
MCPFCLTAMGLFVAGAATGGLAALAVKISRKKDGAGEIQINPDERKNQNGDKHD